MSKHEQVATAATRLNADLQMITAIADLDLPDRNALIDMLDTGMSAIWAIAQEAGEEEMYDEGFVAGRQAESDDSFYIYDDGFENGRSEGYDSGYEDGLRDPQPSS